MKIYDTNVWPFKLKRIACDAEVGHYTRGWHTCNHKAIVSVESKNSQGSFFDYCARHIKAAS